jgi:hypothetical protein
MSNPAHVGCFRRCERSEAIQSREESLDCFVASLLAMTAVFIGLSFRDGPKDQTRKFDLPGSMLRIAPE